MKKEPDGLMLWIQKKNHTDVYNLILDLFNEQLLAHAVSENIGYQDFRKLNEAYEIIYAYKLKKDTKRFWRV